MIACNNPKAVWLAMIGTTFLALTTLTTVSVSAQDVGCCSHDFKTCAEWCTDVTDSTQCGTCESEEYGTLLIWLDQPSIMENSTCVARWDDCTDAPTDGSCCSDLVCYQRSVGYHQCLHPLDIEELERSASPTTSPSPSASPTHLSSSSPTAVPSKSPTIVPTTENPTPNPTSLPSAAPSDSPTSSPTNVPTQSRSGAPSPAPSTRSTFLRNPTASPSAAVPLVHGDYEIETNKQEVSAWEEHRWLWILLLVLGGIIILCAIIAYYACFSCAFFLSNGQSNKEVSNDNDDDDDDWKTTDDDDEDEWVVSSMGKKDRGVDLSLEEQGTEQEEEEGQGQQLKSMQPYYQPKEIPNNDDPAWRESIFSTNSSTIEIYE